MTPAETYRPAPVLAPTTPWRKLVWRLRVFADFQLASIIRDLVPQLENVQGKVIDVGCGDMPYRNLIKNPNIQYTGYDVLASDSSFGYQNAEAVKFDGLHIPDADGSADIVLCTEVLEHHPEPELLIRDIHRVLKKGGKLVLTVPWSARVHFEPYDFKRYTHHALRHLFKDFSSAQITRRGTDVAVIGNKLIVVIMRSAPRALKFNPGAILTLLILLPWLPLILILGQLSIRGWIGSSDDPLGYTVIAIR